MKDTHIVILGSGFAGIHAYKELYRKVSGRDGIRVTIVSDKDYFWFVPMAHEVATGNLTPGSLKQSLRHLPQNGQFDFLQAEVRGIRADRRIVHYVSSDGTEGEMDYDYLVVALGADTVYYDIPGAREHTVPLRSLDEVRHVKNTILARFEEAQKETDMQRKHDLLHFVVVGGGPTGVELVGELIDMKCGALNPAYPELAKLMTVSILQRSKKLVPQESQWISDTVQLVLEKKGVDVKLDYCVSRVDASGLWCGENFLPSRSIIWTAGVKAQEIDIEASRPIERNAKDSRIHVRETLQVDSYPEIFVAGDQAYLVSRDSDQPYPMRAQFAVRQGKTAADNIVCMLEGKELSEFHWKDKGFLVSLGKGSAVARVLGIEFSGRFAWFLYRTAYLPQILGWRAKFRIMLEWTLNLFLPRDLSEL